MKINTKLVTIAAIVASTFSFSAFAENPSSKSGSYGNVTKDNVAVGFVNSASQASASSHGIGTASSSTVSGSFSQFGTIVGFTPASLPEGSSAIKGGTANVSGFTNTQGYAGSTSSTTGTGVSNASSRNSAGAFVAAYMPINTEGVGSGAASGLSTSGTKMNVGTSSNQGNHTSTKGVQATNQGGFSASDSAIQTKQTVSLGGNLIPTILNQTETSANAFNNSTKGDLTGWTNTNSGNVHSSNFGVTTTVAN